MEETEIIDLEEKLNKKRQEQAQEESKKTEEEIARDNAMALNNLSYEETTDLVKKGNLMKTSEDKNFVAELSDKNKEVLSASIDLEREKVETEKQKILLAREKINSEKERDLNERLKEKYGAKLDEQEYHYKSLQPILETFWIKKPMNIYVMWTIALLGCLSLIYPIKLFICATFGNLIAGASSENRKGFAKSCMWTAVAIFGLAMVVVIGFVIVKLWKSLF